jgi:hypothetical protein
MTRSTKATETTTAAGTITTATGTITTVAEMHGETATTPDAGPASDA